MSNNSYYNAENTISYIIRWQMKFEETYSHPNGYQWKRPAVGWLDKVVMEKSIISLIVRLPLLLV